MSHDEHASITWNIIQIYRKELVQILVGVVAAAAGVCASYQASEETTMNQRPTQREPGEQLVMPRIQLPPLGLSPLPIESVQHEIRPRWT